MPDLKSAEAQLAGYTKDLPGLINKAITEAYTPTMESATKEVGSQMAQYLPRFLAATEEPMVGGTTSADLTPAQKLQYMGQRVGELAGNVSRASGLADYLGGNLQNMLQRGQESMQFGLARDTDTYQRAWERARQAEAVRQFNAQLAIQRAQLARQNQPINFPTGYQPTGFQAEFEKARAVGDTKKMFDLLKWSEATQPGSEFDAMRAPLWGDWQAANYGEAYRTQQWQPGWDQSATVPAVTTTVSPVGGWLNRIMNNSNRTLQPGTVAGRTQGGMG